MIRIILLALTLMAAVGTAPQDVLAAPNSPPGCCVLLRTRSATATIDPSALAVRMGTVTVSDPSAPMQVRVDHQDDHGVTLTYPQQDLTVELTLFEDHLEVTATASSPTTFAWPKLGINADEALIWPHNEGSYIPLDDERWVANLTSQTWDTLEGLSMPFWGVERGDQIVTYILANPYHNEIAFTGGDSAVALGFQHVFPANKAQGNPMTYEIYVSQDASPIQPALLFREYLERHGDIVTLKEKAKEHSRIARLIGAPHAYLWGGAPLTSHDVKGEKKGFGNLARQVVAEAKQTSPTVGNRIKKLVSPNQWSQIVELANVDYPYPYLMDQVADVFSAVLLSADLYDAALWPTASLPADIAALTGKSALTEAQQLELNSYLLHSTYSEYLIDPHLWGGGVSVQMLEAIKESDIDHMLLAVDGWEAIDRRPYIAKAASEMGFLLGTYDSYDSIHDPAYKGSDRSWPTAQFDEELYNSGAITNQDGENLTGFKQFGYKLSPIAAWPYVQDRVTENMSKVPYSYYFIDADAFGQYRDDYTPSRMVTQQEDAQARIDRLKWISAAFGVPVGSEGGNYLFASVLAVAEGIIAPAPPTWSDPDLGDKSSKYYLGRYYPPDAPEVFMKPVPMKEKYIHLYIDPRFRLPLYEAVFHDSIITSNHWTSASLKFSNVEKTVAVTQMFYQVPPLYQLNLDRFKEVKDKMRAFYDVFSHSHQTTSSSPVTDFAWLTSDRRVQRIAFDGAAMELVANYTEEPYEFKKTTVPGMSVLLINGANDVETIYMP